MTADPTPTHDQQLPILAELEQTLHARALALMSAPATATDAHPAARRAARESSHPAGRARSRARLAGGRRVLRRAALLAGVTGLVGASAFATHSLVSGEERAGDDPSLRTTAATELAGGSRDGEPWTLSGARRGRDLCDALIVAGTVATRCGPAPGRRGLLLDGLLSPRGRWVVALAGPAVATIELRVGASRRTVATRAVADGSAARASRLPAGLRWIVVALPRGEHDDARVTAIPRDRRGRALGPARQM
ncbi:hypothetical protein VSS74_17155 [Conexibacter stalactiti]|uniref:Anti-sigma factor n=1 Tax=Conexibacter stalactiti TaxID=1940611 RepID=A0ABU4HRX7_9ACTN|nr:hypothetical protein [Conexibacter stalactiti]MDW5596078.1 hypothetical protein [Conexibacter stalactiti]MEC5036720.1 hypothetical protein [Conexibacter stalactiti]